jgi:hypothetical protein
VESAQPGGAIVHDTDALRYALGVLGRALCDERKLAEIAEILARP